MATRVFNEAKKRILTSGIDTANLRALLCMTLSTAGTENDGIVYVADLTTLDELDSASGYSRKTLAGVSIAKDDAIDAAVFDANDLVYTALAAGTRSIQGMLIYEGTADSADDATNEVLCYLQLPASIAADGTDLTLRFSSSGIIQLA